MATIKPGYDKAMASVPKGFNVIDGVMLANEYKNDDLSDGWWMSEKFDGVRATWDGVLLRTRANNKINAPLWFLKTLPVGVVLDGELWAGKGKFQKTVSIVRKDVPVDIEWKNIKYCIFDSPSTEDFETRMKVMQKCVVKTGTLLLVPYIKVSNKSEMTSYFKKIIANNGEGVMLRKQGSMYEQKRSRQLLKVKPVSDAEGLVIDVIEGRGKHAGRMGALIVDYKTKQFKVGTGFTDANRNAFFKKSNIVGKTLTFTYRNFTNSGTPRFAAYLRLRE